MFYIVVSSYFFRHNHTPFPIKNSYNSILEENKIHVNINIFIILFNKKYLTKSNCGCTIFINRKLLLCSVTSPRIALAILAKQSAGFVLINGIYEIRLKKDVIRDHD